MKIFIVFVLLHSNKNLFILKVYSRESKFENYMHTRIHHSQSTIDSLVYVLVNIILILILESLSKLTIIRISTNIQF